MEAQRTAPGRRLTEQRKARARVPLLVLAALVCTPLAGIRSAPVWICYAVFVTLYALWSLRLCAQFAHDHRLGYLLCLTDLAIVLPLLVWSRNAALQAVLVGLCVAGFVVTHVGGRAERRRAQAKIARVSVGERGEARALDSGTGAPLERAVQLRLAVFRATGSRFALVVLRIVRFQETTAYYGEESSQRIMAAVSRRGLRMLGPDAQHFVLPGGRVAFLFEVESGREPGARSAAGAWVDPTDVESLAMTIGRKSCEHLVDGHRVECVVGWASAPADGLNADDLMYVAEAGAQSTAAFRRAAGQVGVPERARVAAG